MWPVLGFKAKFAAAEGRRFSLAVLGPQKDQMKDRRSLAGQDTSLKYLFSAGAFVLAAGVGIYVGWRLFVAPDASETEVPVQLEISAVADGTVSRSVPVQSTGTPSSTLGGAVRVGSPAPEFTLPDMEGEPRSLSDYLGQAVVINFWATWCAPCREEMPALQSAYDKFGEEGFVVLAVNMTQDDHPELIPLYLDELGLTFPVLLDSSGEASNSLYRIIGLPTSLFIGRDGIIREIFIGAIPLDLLDSKVKDLLAEAP
ncbi:MAG: TlpA family protein disulfide reductase [Chloroflexi bacterium]|nr:TlpA family protein disulfide reductase [Chloroflexota bacterium]